MAGFFETYTLEYLIDLQNRMPDSSLCSDYENSDAAAIMLLPELVERGYEPCLEYDVCKWMFAIWKYEDSKESIAVQRLADTISHAITQAVLTLIESESEDDQTR